MTTVNSYWTGVSLIDNYDGTVSALFPNATDYVATIVELPSRLFLATIDTTTFDTISIALNTRIEMSVTYTYGATTDTKLFSLITSDGNLTWDGVLINSVDNNNGTVTVSWDRGVLYIGNTVSADSYIAVDSSYIPYQNQTLSGGNILVSGLSNGKGYLFKIIASYSSSMVYSGGFDGITSLAITPPPWIGSNVQVFDNPDNTITVSWTNPLAEADFYLAVKPNLTIWDPQSQYANLSDPSQTFINVDISNNVPGTYIFYMKAVYTTNYTGSVYSDTSATITIIGNMSNGAPCFLADAPVLTPTGYANISSLVEGDLVMTGDGRPVAIQRVSRTRVAAGPSVNPYVIPKGSYGATKRLLISPEHRIQTENGMVEARHLGLAQEEKTGSFDYYNLELPSWSKDTMVVAGAVVESLAPVRRMTMTVGEFKKALVAQYGELSPTVLAKVQKTCRLVNGHVECPVMKK